MDLNPDLSTFFETELTEQDARLINNNGDDEHTLALLAAEHAARCQALVRCTDPAFAARLFLMMAKRFLEDAKTAQANGCANV